MLGVIQKFFLASMIMWMAPMAILYGFNYQIFPGMFTSREICIHFDECILCYASVV